jgi:hypothetical protein
VGIQLELGTEAIRAYRRMSYQAWYALAEFVDNSTQSYFNNKAALDAALEVTGERLEVSITYDRQNGVIRIVDNAMGMDETELQQAVRIGIPPSNTDGRSEYGMGLKTAACWFGDEWTLTTKKLGSTTELSITVNVDRVASGDTDLRLSPIPKDADQHYTIVEITNLNRNLNGWAVKNTKEYLSAMYDRDLAADLLDLRFDGVSLTAPAHFTDDAFLKRMDNTPYKKAFETEIGGKTVKGWLGVLRPGVASRRLAGITMIRRGRVIRGWLNSWRPEDIYGAGGRNDLLNQRLAGELDVDGFDVSHAKDAILFDGDEEEKLIAFLKELANGADLIHVAREHRGEGPNAPSPAERQAALDELKREMESDDFVNTLNIDEVPPPELGGLRDAPLITQSGTREPDINISVGDQLKIRLFLLEVSPNDPYYAYEISDPKTILITINESHPSYTELSGVEAVRCHLKHCAFDAVAEWKCRQQVGHVQPESVRQIKDRLFHVSTVIE